MSWKSRDLRVLSFVMIGISVLGGCAVMTAVPPVTPALLAASHGASGAMLNAGREVFAGACTACHSTDPVGKHSVVEWRGIVDDMAPKAKLDAAQRAALLAYIFAAHDAAH